MPGFVIKETTQYPYSLRELNKGDVIPTYSFFLRCQADGTKSKLIFLKFGSGSDDKMFYRFYPPNGWTSDGEVYPLNRYIANMPEELLNLTFEAYRLEDYVKTFTLKEFWSNFPDDLIGIMVKTSDVNGFYTLDTRTEEGSWDKQFELPSDFYLDTCSDVVCYKKRLHAFWGVSNQRKHWIYDHYGTNAWITKTDVPQYEYFVYSKAIVYHNKIHLIGGMDYTTAGWITTQKHYTYYEDDSGNAEWNECNILPIKVKHGSKIEVYDDTIHIVNQDKYHYKWDEETDTWINCGNVPVLGDLLAIESEVENNDDYFDEEKSLIIRNSSHIYILYDNPQIKNVWIPVSTGEIPINKFYKEPDLPKDMNIQGASTSLLGNGIESYGIFYDRLHLFGNRIKDDGRGGDYYGGRKHFITVKGQRWTVGVDLPFYNGNIGGLHETRVYDWRRASENKFLEDKQFFVFGDDGSGNLLCYYSSDELLSSWNTFDLGSKNTTLRDNNYEVANVVYWPDYPYFSYHHPTRGDEHPDAFILYLRNVDADKITCWYFTRHLGDSGFDVDLGYIGDIQIIRSYGTPVKTLNKHKPGFVFNNRIYLAADYSNATPALFSSTSATFGDDLLMYLYPSSTRNIGFHHLLYKDNIYCINQTEANLYKLKNYETGEWEYIDSPGVDDNAFLPLVFNGKIRLIGGYTTPGTSWYDTLSKNNYSFSDSYSVKYENKRVKRGWIKDSNNQIRLVLNPKFKKLTTIMDSKPDNFDANSKIVYYKGEIHFFTQTYHYKYSYDNAGVFDLVSELPYTFTRGAAIVYNDEIHLIGGYSTSGLPSTLGVTKHYKWNSTDGWVQVTDSLAGTKGLYDVSAVVYKDKIYAVGRSGTSERSPSTYLMYYDETNGWLFAGSKNQDLNYTMVNYSNRLHLFIDETGSTGTTEHYISDDKFNLTYVGITPYYVNPGSTVRQGYAVRGIVSHLDILVFTNTDIWRWTDSGSDWELMDTTYKGAAITQPLLTKSIGLDKEGVLYFIQGPSSSIFRKINYDFL